ncbi:uncharacterized protein SAMN06297144_2843 [Sphingomonas guangdongensis]|uniref:DUF418 domain-containing protein n=1 Tax=Sphingomonas guangdongensis TaxID=1141890 RepID=A0A285R5U3_9SPHN|nr:DUF418 domain-containing protein [Sphingomonas guangdongensis]SOB87707.1 uncharacterized protein SAMN06297144_2843 [Sphingomonas guangdongensis]
MTATTIDTAVTSSKEPDGAPRVANLDILRGLAILGILFMNINDMGQSMTASFGDIRHLGWTTADQVAWAIREVLANGTARGLLQLLFGVGMVILTDRAAGAAATRWQLLRGYWWRNLVLFVLGVAHMYLLLWPGDILHTYALAAMVAVLFRRLRPRWLLTVGLIFAVLQLVGGGFFGYYRTVQLERSVATAQAEQRAGRTLSAEQKKELAAAAKSEKASAQRDAERAQKIATEDKGRLGSARDWALAQTNVSLTRFPTFEEIFSVWESLSFMLIGAALWKLGILGGARSRGFYVRLAAVAYLIGVPLRAIGAWEQMQFGDGPYLYWATNEVARLAMTLGHVGLVYALLASARGMRLLRPFEAAGRTALTIYIAQTLICLWVLYPPFGLHLYREQGWAALMLTALALNAALLWGANWWVRHYRIAPVEWLWRSIVEGRRLPFRKRAPLGKGSLPLPA